MSSEDSSLDMESLAGALFITSPFTDDAERQAPFSPTRTLTSGVIWERSAIFLSWFDVNGPSTESLY